ncbi:MAG: hypothetical protein WCR67_03520 [Bacilli bacterium]
MDYQKHSKFPLKKCIIATVVFLIIATMILALIYSVIYSTDSNDVGRIFVIVTVALTGAAIIGYWIYQVIKYIEKRKDEN